MRFIETNSEKIMKELFLGGIVILIGYVLTFWLNTSNFQTKTFLNLIVICRVIGKVVIFKFICDVAYKILKALDKYNKE